LKESTGHNSIIYFYTVKDKINDDEFLELVNTVLKVSDVHLIVLSEKLLKSVEKTFKGIDVEGLMVDYISFSNIDKLDEKERKILLKNVCVSLARKQNVEYAYIISLDQKDVVDKVERLHSVFNESKEYDVLALNATKEHYEVYMRLSDNKLKIEKESFDNFVEGEFVRVLVTKLDAFRIKVDKIPKNVIFRGSGPYNPDFDFCLQLLENNVEVYMFY